MSTHQLRRRWVLLGSLSLFYVALSCAIGSRAGSPPPAFPRQSWWDERGPVVRHDTFPTECELCHEGESWSSIREDFTFDHEAETGTPLLGAHQDAECLRCHNDRGPVQRFARRGCSGCHEDVHRSRMGQACSNCHTPDDWEVRDMIARHQRTRFPLIGAHAATACWACHPGSVVGNFDRAPTECVTCHRDDLARAVSFDHQANGISDRCDRCHIPTSWTGAAFNHFAFPLTGPHALDCMDCHTIPGNTQQFSCTHCHAHGQAEMANQHEDVSGYVWSSAACYSCHPTGEGD